MFQILYDPMASKIPQNKTMSPLPSNKNQTWTLFWENKDIKCVWIY